MGTWPGPLYKPYPGPGFQVPSSRSRQLQNCSALDADDALGPRSLSQPESKMDPGSRHPSLNLMSTVHPKYKFRHAKYMSKHPKYIF